MSVAGVPEATLVFGDAALAACVDVLRHVTAQLLDQRTPCTEFTVRELGDHVTRSMILLSGVAGRELAPLPDATLAESVATLGSAAIGAWRERGVDGAVAVGRTITPAPLAADIITLELIVHGWDVGRAVGVDFEVDDEVAEHLLVQAAQLITEDKRGRAFAPATDAEPGATPLQRLVAFTGRTV